MKAIIKYKESGRARQKTIEVLKNEPNAILRELLGKCEGITKRTYVTTIKCGLHEYQWNGDVRGAF